MGEFRIATLLGPVAVLYLVADAASRRGRLTAVELTVGGVAALASLGPRWVRGPISLGESGARRVGWLGFASSAALSSRIATESPSIASAVISALASAALGGLVLDLACTVPDAPRGLRRLRAPLVASAVLAGAVGVVSALPTSAAGRYVGAGRVELSLVPWVFLLVATVLAVLVRALRERMGSGPSAVAANAWALLGLVPALVVGTAAFVFTELSRGTAPFRGDLIGSAFAFLAVQYGHIALVEPSRRIEAAGAARRALEWTLAGAVVVVASLVAAWWMPRDPIAAALVALLLLAVATIVRRLVRPVVMRLLAPAGGKLLDALGRAEEASGTATTLDAFAEALLLPLRVASGDERAEPRLVLTDPDLVYRLDAAGIAHSRSERSSELLVRYFAEDVSSPIVFAELDARVVRRPELRPMHELLSELGALVVVPIVVEGQLDAILVVPNGSRNVPPSLEELDRLERFARTVAPRLSLIAAQFRAEKRLATLGAARDRAEERAEALDDEVRRLRTEVRVLRQDRGSVGRATTVVAYSAAGRDLERAIAEVAPTPSSVLLVAEPGMHVDRIAMRIHAASGVAEGPFVLADCAALLDDEVERAFFGVEGDAASPGYLRLADGGTLLLADAAALPMAVQKQLAEALATRASRAVGSHAIHAFDVRVVAASRMPVEILVERGALDPELGRRIGSIQIRVPPLRERIEDLPSLALLAVDRAARRLGRASVGIDQAALERLIAHPWPGNVRELELVLELAVEDTPGEMVVGDTVARLLAGTSPVAEASFDGSLVDIERRALIRALELAAGNKSEAARALGLKRTTFLDKLRRLGLEDDKGSETGEGA